MPYKLLLNKVNEFLAWVRKQTIMPAVTPLLRYFQTAVWLVSSQYLRSTADIPAGQAVDYQTICNNQQLQNGTLPQSGVIQLEPNCNQTPCSLHLNYTSTQVIYNITCESYKIGGKINGFNAYSLPRVNLDSDEKLASKSLHLYKN